jgi:hypothetical protein
MPNPVVPSAAVELAQRLAQPEPMRRGSLSERYVKCSKSGCACGEDPKARHGPYYSLTRGVSGTTRSRLLTAEQAKVASAQIEAARRFRQVIEDYWEACERWADAQLEGSATTVAEKGGSKRPSRRRSPPRSTR